MNNLTKSRFTTKISNENGKEISVPSGIYKTVNLHTYIL